MDYENQQSNTKFFIKVFIALIILAILIGGYFYLSKKNTPLTVKNDQSTPLPKGFERDVENKISTEFPKGLIVEKDIVPIESFSVKNGVDLQNTYRYITKLTIEENYRHFSKFASTNGWKVLSDVKSESNRFMLFSKQNAVLSVSYSLNTITENAIMDITLSQKINE